MITWCRCGHNDADHVFQIDRCMCCGCPEMRAVHCTCDSGPEHTGNCAIRWGENR